MHSHQEEGSHSKRKGFALSSIFAVALCLCLVIGITGTGYAYNDEGNIQVEQQQEVEEYTIPENETPLAVVDTQGVWSLLNLIIAAAGGVLAVILLSIGMVTDKKEDKDMESITYGYEAKPEKKISLPWMVVSIFTGISAIMIFMLTQNIDETMVAADRWTPLMVGVIAAQIIFSWVALRKRSKKSSHLSHA